MKMNLYPLEDAWNGIFSKDESVQEATDWTQIILKMQPLTADNMVKKKVFKQGLIKDGKAPPGCTVLFHLIMFVDDHEEPIDNSLVRDKPQKIDLSTDGVIEGLEIALTSMRKGEISMVAINYKYGYGELGAPPRIPGKARLMVAIQLIDFYKAGSADHVISSLPEEGEQLDMFQRSASGQVQFRQVYRQAVKCYKQGIKMYKDADWYTASQFFEKASTLLNRYRLKNEKEQKKQERLLFKIYLNFASSSLKIKRPAIACTCCREALDLRPGDIRAMYRFGKAKLMLEDAESALRLFQQVLEVRPDMSNVQEMYEEALKELQARDRIGDPNYDDDDNIKSWEIESEEEPCNDSDVDTDSETDD